MEGWRIFPLCTACGLYHVTLRMEIDMHSQQLYTQTYINVLR
jgi:hypothetical protein